VFSSAVASAAPDLDVDKQVDVATPAPDQPVEFSIDVRNIGADPATDVHVQDALPPGLTIPTGLAPFPGSGTYDADSGDWTVGDLAPLEGATLRIPAVVTEAVPPDCIVNTAEVSHPDDDNPNNDRAMVAVRQPGIARCVDVSAGSLDVDTASDCGIRRTLVIMVDVRNQGTDAASDVAVTLEQSPVIAPNLRFSHSGCVGGRCAFARLARGETIRLLAESDEFANPVPRDLRITVQASSDDADFAPGNNTAFHDGALREFTDCGDIDTTGGCFIASTASASALELHVAVLRQFRDKQLLRSAAGRALVRLYYRYSPAAARAIARDETLRAAARWLIAPLVLAIAYPWPALSLAVALAAALLCARRPARRGRSP
jgi:uncharacterized repeat protein (TIGR01451 family)